MVPARLAHVRGDFILYCPSTLKRGVFNKTEWLDAHLFFLHCMGKKVTSCGKLNHAHNFQSMHLRWVCCRWCRSPPTAAGRGSPRQRSTDTPACTARFWRPPPEWRHGACCRLSLSVLWSQFHNICPGSCSRSRWTPGRGTKDTIHIHYL